MRGKFIARAIVVGLPIAFICIVCVVVYRYDTVPRVIEVDSSSDGQYRAEVLNARDSSMNTVRFTDASGQLLIGGEFAEENVGVIWDDHAFRVWFGASSSAVQNGICAGNRVIRLPLENEDDLAVLQKFGGFKELSLDGDFVFADASLQQLRSMSCLRKLSLYGYLFTDKTIATVGPLPALERMELSGSNFDDTALAAIQGYTGLIEMLLYDTGVSQHGVDALHTAYPHLKIRIASKQFTTVHGY